MRWQVEFRASEQPEEWAPLRKEGGSTLKFEAQDQAEHRAAQFAQVQPHVPVRVVPIYG